jgi:phenylalanyl-tRNA synthetase beta chain
MRPEMLLSTLLSVQYNHNRQQKDLRLFEFGQSYKQKDGSFYESEKLTITLTGAEEKESWLKPQKSTNYYSLKKIVLEVLEALGIQKYQIAETDDERFDYGMKYHRGQQIIVHFGKVEKDICTLMEVKGDVYYAEFEMKTLLSYQKNNTIAVTDIPRYPVSRRDLALTVENHIKYSDIEKIVSTVGKNMITDINLFDVYRDETALGSGKKSYAISMVFSDSDKNLSDKDIDKVISKIIYQCQNSVGAVLR